MANDEDITSAPDVLPGELAVSSVGLLLKRHTERGVDEGHDDCACILLRLEKEDEQEDFIQNSDREDKAPEERMWADEGTGREDHHTQNDHEEGDCHNSSSSIRKSVRYLTGRPSKVQKHHDDGENGCNDMGLV